MSAVIAVLTSSARRQFGFGQAKIIIRGFCIVVIEGGLRIFEIFFCRISIRPDAPILATQRREVRSKPARERALRMMACVSRKCKCDDRPPHRLAAALAGRFAEIEHAPQAGPLNANSTHRLTHFSQPAEM